MSSMRRETDPARATGPSRCASNVQLAATGRDKRAPVAGSTAADLVARLQRTAGNRATSGLLAAARQRSGDTDSLPFRREMEETFQADLGGLRVMRGVEGLPAAGATRGRDILFQAQEPSLPLVAHEVAHALQNRQGQDSRATIARSESAEREADLAGIRAVTGGVMSVGAQGSAGWQLRKGDYAGLKNPLTKARTRQLAETKYRTEAADFEKRLGLWLAQSQSALAAARKLATNIKVTAVEYFRSVGQNPDVAAVWGAEKKKITGAVAHTQKVIDKVLVKGNLREILGLVYQAFTGGGLTRLLDQARTEIVASAAKKKKVAADLAAAESAHTAAASRAGGAGIFDKALAFFGLAEDDEKALAAAVTLRDTLRNAKTTSEGEERDISDKWRAAGLSLDELTSEELEAKRRGFTAKDASRAYFKRSDVVGGQDRSVAPKGTPYQAPTVGDVASRDVPLSSRELKLAFPAQYGQAKGLDKALWKTLDEDARRQAINVNAEKLSWKPGEYVYQLGPKLQKWADDVGVLLMGGLSGSTDTYLRAAKYFGMTSVADLQGMRLAALGSMIPARDHSFAEIMMAAREFGLRDYEPGPAGYRTIAPLSEADILLGTGSQKFPDHWRSQEYLDELAENLVGGATETGTVTGTDIESLLGVASHDPTSGAADPLPADVRNLVVAVSTYGAKKKAAEDKEKADGRDQALEERAAQVTDLVALMTSCASKLRQLRAMTGGYDRTKQRQLEALHAVAEWSGSEYGKLGAKPNAFAKVKTSVIEDLRKAGKLPAVGAFNAAGLRAGGFEAGPLDLALRVEAETAVAGKVELNIKKTNAVRRYLAERERAGKSGPVTKSELTSLPHDHELRSVFDFGRLVDVGGYLEDFIMDTALLEAVVRGRSVASAQDAGKSRTDELTQARQAAATSVNLRELAAVHEYTKGTNWYTTLNNALSGKPEALAGLDDDQQRLIRLTVSGLTKMGRIYPFAGTVYRGIKRMKEYFGDPVANAAKIKAWTLKNYPIGHVGHAAKILTSTSKRAETSFAAKPDYNVALEITKTRSGADITLLAQLAEAEREVLFPPGVQFKTVGHEFDLTGKRIGKPLVWIKQEEV